MRKSICFLLFLYFTFSLSAQQPTPLSAPTWDRVLALPTGANIYVNGHPHAHCYFLRADAASITCAKSHAKNEKELTFARSTVTTIKRSHRGRSALIGLGIGAGTGSAIGFAAGTSSGNGFFGPNFMRGAVTAVFGVAGAVIGTPIGAATDFARTTVYKAP